MYVGTTCTEYIDTLAQIVGAGFDCQFLFFEKIGGPFLAVIHNLARLSQSVDVIGA
jgi:hypothetical protein